MTRRHPFFQVYTVRLPTFVDDFSQTYAVNPGQPSATIICRMTTRNPSKKGLFSFLSWLCIFKPRAIPSCLASLSSCGGGRVEKVIEGHEQGNVIKSRHPLVMVEYVFPFQGVYSISPLKS
ncbi:hypothetical protein CDAR_437681 [Caerostris darwini]|uniref:Uncharacterized protein n=1 Tax=Caerostris darwini TaxID=1538125 RepID=A0AAV4NU82_9ARAC|nr:hypothetical protein CDAR_437681 [Caerostris darwini]